MTSLGGGLALTGGLLIGLVVLMAPRPWMVIGPALAGAANAVWVARSGSADLAVLHVVVGTLSSALLGPGLFAARTRKSVAGTRWSSLLSPRVINPRRRRAAMRASRLSASDVLLAVTIVLVAVSSAAIALPEVLRVPAPAAQSAAVMAALGLLAAGLAGQPRRALGVLLALSAFAGLYTLLQPSAVVVATLAVFQLSVAAAFGHLLATHAETGVG